MTYTIIDTGGSRSFAVEHAFIKGAVSDGEVVVVIGSAVGAVFSRLATASRRRQCCSSWAPSASAFTPARAAAWRGRTCSLCALLSRRR